MNNNNEILKEILTKAGGNVNNLPDNLKSTLYAAIILKCGGNVDDLPDQLETTYLERIAECTSVSGDYESAFEAGKKSQYDEFWDGFMNNGTRTSFPYAFAYWSDKIFYPKYDIRPTNANSMFTNSSISNIKQRLIDCGVVLDTSKVQNFTQMFGYMTNLTHLPVIDARLATTMYLTFVNCNKLVQVEKIILSENSGDIFAQTFDNCTSLVDITFEGVIGGTIRLWQSTKLSKASITSVINALSTATSNLTAYFSKTAVETAFGSTASAEWTTLVGTKSNWTISLI